MRGQGCTIAPSGERNSSLSFSVIDILQLIMESEELPYQLGYFDPFSAYMLLPSLSLCLSLSLSVSLSLSFSLSLFLPLSPSLSPPVYHLCLATGWLSAVPMQ